MQFRQWLRQILERPYLAAGVVAFVVFFGITVFVDFTFMADDWSHLASAYSLENPFRDRFSQWLGRVPVWAIVAWALFSSHVLEATWAPMYLFFVAHVVGVVLVCKWLAKELFELFETETPHAPLLILGVAVVALHPNTYEILFWPTCMPYALGGLFMAAALWTKPGWRFCFLLLAFLTYETFFLPSLALIFTPPLLRATKNMDWRSLINRQRLVALGVWLGAAVVTLAVRAIGASQVGGFSHQTTLTVRHVGRHLNLAFNQLFKIHFAFSGTNEIVTIVQVAILLLAVVLLWNALRWRTILLLCLVFASTGVYWVLNYSAMRAIYGSQIFFGAVLVVLVCMADRAKPKARIGIAAALALLGLGYTYQTATILSVKHFNASVLATQELRIARQLRDCPTECVIEHGALDNGLRRDWVLHRDYWGYYLDYLRAKHAPKKQVQFVFLDEENLTIR